MAAPAPQTRRIMRPLIRWVLIAALVYALLPEAPDRPNQPSDRPTVWLVDHGFHVGLIMAREDLADLPFASDFPDARWFEIGWGDQGFYTQARTLEDVSSGLAAQALLWPTPSVLQVVALRNRPTRVFAPERMAALRIDAVGRARLATEIARTLTRPLAVLGPGLYGDSRFYRAEPAYHLLRVCNHWLSDLLNGAGLPSSTLWSTLPAGLFAELRLRGAVAPPDV